MRTLVFLMGVMLVMPFSVRADDVADLTAASDGVLAALNALDAEAASKYFAEETIAFGQNAPLLDEGGREAVVQGFGTFLANVEQYSFTLNDRVVRVWGSTGITASNAVLSVQEKGGTLQISGYRLLTVWAKIDGGWKIVGTHASFYPSGRPN